ncbi:MAG TPA: hypothetical protein VF510_22810 [Ktedonobacterales bacterium]
MVSVQNVRRSEKATHLKKVVDREMTIARAGMPQPRCKIDNTPRSLNHLQSARSNGGNFSGKSGNCVGVTPRDLAGTQIRMNSDIAQMCSRHRHDNAARAATLPAISPARAARSLAYANTPDPSRISGHR